MGLFRLETAQDKFCQHSRVTPGPILLKFLLGNRLFAPAKIGSTPVHNTLAHGESTKPPHILTHTQTYHSQTQYTYGWFRS